MVVVIANNVGKGDVVYDGIVTIAPLPASPPHRPRVSVVTRRTCTDAILSIDFKSLNLRGSGECCVGRRRPLQQRNGGAVDGAATGGRDPVARSCTRPRHRGGGRNHDRIPGGRLPRLAAAANALVAQRLEQVRALVLQRPLGGGEAALAKPLQELPLHLWGVGRSGARGNKSRPPKPSQARDDARCVAATRVSHRRRW